MTQLKHFGAIGAQTTRKGKIKLIQQVKTHLSSLFSAGMLWNTRVKYPALYIETSMLLVKTKKKRKGKQT